MRGGSTSQIACGRSHSFRLVITFNVTTAWWLLFLKYDVSGI